VYPGDKVKIEAYAKYTLPSGTTSNLTGFATALLNAFGAPVPGSGETGTLSAALNNWGSLVVGGDGGESSGPKAFVNIVVFDKYYNLLDASWEAMDPNAHQDGATPVVPHDYMMREYTVKEEGYVFMFVSNENPTLVDVHFDDVVMTLTKSNLIQYNEYYPFGMQTAGTWTRENTLGNNFLANGGTELNTTSNLYDLDYRNYDPVLGRMNGVDPLATKYASLTPYNFSFNDPVTFSDPSGASPEKTWIDAHRELEQWFNNTSRAPVDPGGGGIGGWGGSGYYNSVMGGYGGTGMMNREFGMSMSFGALPYSEAGRMQEAQMKHDAENMSKAEYGRKYGTTYVNRGSWKSDATTTTSGNFEDGTFTVHGVRDVWVDNWVKLKSSSTIKSQTSEFNITFTFGLVIGFNIGDFVNVEARPWTFGEIGSKTDFNDEEWRDGKITSVHYGAIGILNLTYGRGFEHRLGYKNGEFYSRDRKEIKTNWGATTIVDPVNHTESKELKNTIFFIGLGLFSVELSKDLKK